MKKFFEYINNIQFFSVFVAVVVFSGCLVLPQQATSQDVTQHVTTFDEALRDLVCAAYPEIPDCSAVTGTVYRQYDPSRVISGNLHGRPMCLGADGSVCVGCALGCETSGRSCQCKSSFGKTTPPYFTARQVVALMGPLLRESKVEVGQIDRVGIGRITTSSGPGDPTAAPNQTVSEVIKYCEGCECHYGICSVETQTCEYIGSGIEEDLC